MTSHNNKKWETNTCAAFSDMGNYKWQDFYWLFNYPKGREDYSVRTLTHDFIQILRDLDNLEKNANIRV